MRVLIQKMSAIQEAVVVTTIFVGWFIYGSLWVMLAGYPAGLASGYNDAAAISLVIWECAMFAIGALVLYWRGWKAGDFLFPLGWRHVLPALLLLALDWLINALIWETIGSRLEDGSLLRTLAQTDSVSFGAAVLLSAVNGTFEEFFLCRYLIERFRESSATFAIMLSATIRMLYHVYQGPQGTLSILAFGIMIGAYYWRTRALGAVVLAHVLADLIALS
jgi:uncharacterized protein